MVGWKRIFNRSRSRGPLDPIPDLTDYDCLISPSITEQEKRTGDSDTENIRPPMARHNPVDFLPDDIQDYYYPDMDKDSANLALQGRQVGTFLLRTSKSPDAKYTLSVRSDKHVFNVRIFYREEDSYGYHLDSPKQLRKYFPSISALLRYYSMAPRELIALCEGPDEKSTFRLRYPLSRSDNALNLDNLVENQASPSALPPRIVSRQTNGGSLKAMVNWL